MLRNRKLGAGLAVAGIVANNFVYLYDVLLDTSAGWIYLGWKGWVGVVASLAVSALGLAILVRAQPGEDDG